MHSDQVHCEQVRAVSEQEFVEVFVKVMAMQYSLTKPTVRLFRIVYRIMRESTEDDRVELTSFIIAQHDKTMQKRTYQRAMRELLEKKIIFNSPTESLYFYNTKLSAWTTSLRVSTAYQIAD